MSTISIILRLVMVGAVVGSLYFVVSAINDSVRDHYVAPVKKEYEDRIATLQAQVDAQRQLNQTIQTNADTCNKRVDELKLESNQRDKLQGSAIEAFRARAARDQSMIQALVDRAKGPTTKGDFCEQAQVAYRALVELANRQRLRDKPTGPDGAGSEGAGEGPVHR